MAHLTEEQMQQLEEALKTACRCNEWRSHQGMYEEALSVIRAARAQEKEQKVASWRCQYCNTDMPTEHASNCPIEICKLPNEYAAPSEPVKQAPVTWKPIQTAPRHGRILVTGTHLGTCVVSAGWDTDTPDDIRWEVVNDIVVHPTHWMPLPALAKPFVYTDSIADAYYAACLAEQENCKECGAKQAQIDSLMLEYCPNEMTFEQRQEWGNNQRLANQAHREGLSENGGMVESEVVNSNKGADTNPLSVFAKECSLGTYTPDEIVKAARLALIRASEQKREWVDLTPEEIEGAVKSALESAGFGPLAVESFQSRSSSLTVLQFKV